MKCLKYEGRKIRDKIILKVIKLLPTWIVYNCTVRAIAFYTTGNYGSTEVPKLTAMDLLKRFENKDFR